MEGVVLVGKWFEHIPGFAIEKWGFTPITFTVSQNIGIFLWFFGDVSRGPYTKIYQTLMFQFSWYLGLWEQFAKKSCLT